MKSLLKREESLSWQIKSHIPTISKEEVHQEEIPFENKESCQLTKDKTCSDT